ncbi:unnamed protein product [Paramecium octaurelia]|uniref:Major facilitator superfamily protein n=1 Tax=Paramecium octaurelia TaxID=43137 RepID=A0A8S1WRR1_PAROT|nr:unnamed protein product [Paramecium octaurelia]
MKKYANLGKVLYMNIVLTFHLSQCLALASLLPQIVDQNNYSYLGGLGLICIYTVNLIFNLVAPLYLTKMKYRYGFTFQAGLVLPCFIPAYIISRCDGNDVQDLICNPIMLIPLTLVGCVFLGAGLGGYFVLQNTYVSHCSTDKNKELFFGVTYMLLGSSYLLNGVTSDQLLSYIGRENYFLYSGLFECILSLLFIFVQQPDKGNQNQISEANQCLIQNDSVDKPEEQVANINKKFAKIGFKAQIKQIIQKFQLKEMKFLFSLFISTGVVIGFEFGIFHKFISASLPGENEITVNVRTARIFLFVGVAQILSGICNGLSRYFFGIIQNSIFYGNVFQCLNIIAIISAFQKNYNINIILGFLIGFTDNSGQFNSAVIISDIWNEDMAIFGLYLFCQNFGVMFTNLVAIFLDGQSLVYYLLLLIALQCTTSFSQQQFKRSLEKE